MIKSIGQVALTHSPALFAIRQHLAMAPAILAGTSGGARRSWSQHGEDTRIVEELKLVRETFKPIFPLAMILERCKPADREIFALLTVDTEGWDELVLRSNDWEFGFAWS